MEFQDQFRQKLIQAQTNDEVALAAEMHLKAKFIKIVSSVAASREEALECWVNMQLKIVRYQDVLVKFDDIEFNKYVNQMISRICIDHLRKKSRTKNEVSYAQVGELVNTIKFEDAHAQQMFEDILNEDQVHDSLCLVFELIEKIIPEFVGALTPKKRLILTEVIITEIKLDESKKEYFQRIAEKLGNKNGGRISVYWTEIIAEFESELHVISPAAFIDRTKSQEIMQLIGNLTSLKPRLASIM